MKPARTLLLAGLISCSVHLLVLLAPGSALPEPPGEALRITFAQGAVVTAPVAQPRGKNPSKKPGPRKTASEGAAAKEGASRALLPETQATPPEPVSEASSPLAESAIPPAAASPAMEASVNASAPVLGPRSDEPVLPLLAASARLPRSGRIDYVGNASLLNVMGLVSWEHDGARYKARLGAGVVGATSSFNYESSGVLAGAQVISERSHDSRRGRESTAQIDHQQGLVSMQRNGDLRERQISGLAVALSSLPQALACLDEKIEKAALFIVGDFWVEDAVVINRGLENLVLPDVTVEARRFQSRIKNGKTIDIWLVPAWQNAPARIRYDDGGFVVDIRATEVEIEGRILLRASNTSG